MSTESTSTPVAGMSQCLHGVYGLMPDACGICLTDDRNRLRELLRSIELYLCAPTPISVQLAHELTLTAEPSSAVSRKSDPRDALIAQLTKWAADGLVKRGIESESARGWRFAAEEVKGIIERSTRPAGQLCRADTGHDRDANGPCLECNH